MAFSYTTNQPDDKTGRRAITGTYANTAGSTGGEIKTGLMVVEYFAASPAAAAVVANQPVANETFPLSRGDVTLVTNANEGGVWHAIGY